MELFISIIQTVGTIAFASSGALTAMKKHMDYLGVVVLAVITSVGGGIIRDLVLGYTPPSAFRDPNIVFIAIIASVILLIPQVRHRLLHNQRRFDIALFWMDSMGLGLFTAMGVFHAKEISPDFSNFLLTFTGVISGVGGGVLRDLLAGDMPYIFIKHTYACASIVGALVCTLLWGLIPSSVAMLLCVVLVFALRLLAARYNWNLPRVNDVK